MMLIPGTTWGDIQDILDNMEEPLQGPTNFFGLTRDEIMAYPPEEEVFPIPDEEYEEDYVSPE